MLLALNPTLQTGVAGGRRDAGIANLDHQVDLGQVVGERALCFGDVARIPLNRRGRATQQLTHGTTITGQGAN